MLSIELFNQILGVATIFAQIAIVVIVLALLNKKPLFSKQAMLLAFLVSLAGVAGSLYYSEFIGYEPCKLCWYQRVFLYPQTILLAIGLIKKHPHVANYCILFSGLGGLLALYQSLLTVGLAPSIPCSASGVSCSQIFVMQFGYITIPVMALTAFLLIIVLLLSARSGKSD